MAVFDSENTFLRDCSTVTDHPFTFKIFKDTDMVISLINQETQEETPLELNTDYTVEISRIEDGGVVKLTQAHPGYNVYGVRSLALIQPEQVPTEGNFPEKSIEDALDRGCMISQQLKEEIDRSIKLPGYVSIANVDIEVPQDGKALVWGLDGENATIKNSKYNPDEVVAECQTQVQLAAGEVQLAKVEVNNAKAEADRASLNAEAAAAITGQFPAAVNLTTWARLNDGKIYNIPFADVKADTNRFIQFKDTSDRRTLTLKKNTFIRLETSTDVRHLCVWEDTDLDVQSLLDEGDTLTNGKDYSIFLVPDGETGVTLKVSLNKTAPIGYDTYNTRRIGGFHTECANVGTVQANHPLNGWLAGDIIPSTVWTLWHKPAVASPSGMYYHKRLDGWRPIYVQSGTLENTTFEFNATVTRSRSGWDHEVDLGLVGLEFATSTQFTIASLGVVPLKAVNGKAESSCTKAGGWVNENGVRMVTEEGEESTCGGLWEILKDFAAIGGSGWAASGSNTLTKPHQYGSINRLMGGGIWTDSGYAGPSSRLGNNSASTLYTYVSARGWSRPYRPAA